MEWVDLQLQCLDGYELHTVIMPRTAQEAGARRSFNGFVGVKPAIGCLISEKYAMTRALSTAREARALPRTDDTMPR